MPSRSEARRILGGRMKGTVSRVEARNARAQKRFKDRRAAIAKYAQNRN
jgi:hypothetical protein